MSNRYMIRCSHSTPVIIMIRSVIYIVFLLTTSILPAIAQHRVKGSGYILTQQRETEFFNSIEVADGIHVFIVPGELQPITIEADDNLFPYIKTVIRNRVLKIYIPDTVDIVKYTDMNVLISMPVLQTLKASTGSKIDASPQVWKSDSILLRVRTGGYIKLHTRSVYLDLEARTSGYIELKGNSQRLLADLKTGARLSARNFQASDAILELATGSRADLKVTGQVSYCLCGNARLILRGNPKILKSELSSGSKVFRER